MKDYNVTNGLVCTWVRVTDESGRGRMEARWSAPSVLAARAA